MRRVAPNAISFLQRPGQNITLAIPVPILQIKLWFDILKECNFTFYSTIRLLNRSDDIFRDLLCIYYRVAVLRDYVAAVLRDFFDLAELLPSSIKCIGWWLFKKYFIDIFLIYVFIGFHLFVIKLLPLIVFFIRLLLPYRCLQKYRGAVHRVPINCDNIHDVVTGVYFRDVFVNTSLYSSPSAINYVTYYVDITWRWFNQSNESIYKSC